MSFRLFPYSPSAKSLFDKDALRREWRNGGPVICQAIMVVCITLWLVEILLRFFSPTLLSLMLSYGMIIPAMVPHQPWTLITNMFLHEPGLTHVLFNMLTLWCVGPLLEKLLGHWRFLGMYLLCGLGGDAGLLIWSHFYGGSSWLTGAYGASGALFGLFAAILITYRRIGADISSMLIWMVINFAMPLVYPNIAWQAHVGGFVIGGVYAWLLIYDVPSLRRQSLGRRSLIYGGCLLVVLAAVIFWALIPVLRSF